jgi:formin 2
LRSGSLENRLSDVEKEAKVWEKIDDLPIKDWDDFHELFSRQVVEKKVAKKVEATNKPVRQQAMKVLDSKRSQNVGILVKSLNLDIEQVKLGTHANYETVLLITNVLIMTLLLISQLCSSLTCH